MIYKAHIPTRLDGIVSLIWEHEITEPGRFTILPSGKVELIFPIHGVKNLDALNISRSENPMNNYSCFLSGLHTKPLKVTFEKFHTFGIQMKPVAVKALFGMPLCEIRNYFVEGSLLFKTIELMQEQLQIKRSFERRASWFETFMLKKLVETPQLHEAINIDRAVRKLISPEHRSSGKSVEDLIGYSRTHTYRLFNDWFGTSAQTYQSLMRHIKAVERLHDKDLKLVEVGCENGFYDQAHFIRTFQRFTDLTPGQYRRQMSDLPGHIFG